MTTLKVNIGDIFTRLTVLKESGRNKHGKIQWLCKCECGTEIITLGTYLREGTTKSCGCYGREMRILSRKTHGQSHKTSEYETWKAIKARCNNPKNIKYSDYGGRGIRVCDRWLRSFENFYADMGDKPTPTHSLDRYPDVNGNYCLENCRWGTWEQQSRNKRNNRWFEYGGLKMIMEDWSKFFGVDQSTLHEHLQTKDFGAIYNFYKKKNEKLLSKGTRRAFNKAK